MIIKKILNNNSVLVEKDRTEYIIFGAGVGFNYKKGQKIDEKIIEKKFIATSEFTEKYAKLIENIPLEYIKLSNEIIDMAKKELKYEISNSIYISLTDHLFNLINLCKEGYVLENPISWEIKKFYPKEYHIGEDSLEKIKEVFGLEVYESEAANIAMHIINAQISDHDSKSLNVQSITKKIRDILDLIKVYNKIEIDESSLDFDRFITHLRFFFNRISGERNFEVSNPLLVEVVKNYPQAYDTTKIIEKYLNIVLNDDE
ncbi:PRD domain-containing protein [Helcococcus kunzii]|uniref:PRD domain-containing protein n=1 Tax=Helcococcus kunzii TaxID=40091 RepID=UPI0024ACEADC|nr:PRD domain-containing protein [Helcococcus kunzii]